MADAGGRSHSIILDFFLTIVTIGIWNLWVQWRQITEFNSQFQTRKIPHPWIVIILSVLTFGLYFIYHEFQMTREIHRLVENRTYPLIELAAGVGTFFGLWFIVDSYQQHLLNDYFE